MALDLYKYISSIPTEFDIKDKIVGEDGQKVTQLEFNSPINIFISPNNSGKSLLIRNLMKSILTVNGFVYRVDDEEFEKLNKILREIVKLLEFTFTNYIFQPNIVITSVGKYGRNDFILHYRKIIEALDERDYQKILQLLVNPITYEILINPKSQFILGYIGSSSEIIKNAQSPKTEIINSEYNKIVGPLVSYLNNVIPELDLKKIYIPNMRTIRRYSDTTSLIYDKTLSEYFEHKDSDGNIIEKRKYSLPELIDGQKIYDDFFTKRNSSKEGLEKIEAYEEFLSKNFFNGQKVFFITNYDRDSIEGSQLKIKIGEEDDMFLYELGDGIQQVIMLTYPIFFYDSAVLFIEEPEINLHAGMQKRLMEIYNSEEYRKNFMFFIVTHSNHIVDKSLSINAAIFDIEKESGKKEPKFKVRNVSNSLGQTFDSMGISASSALLTNGVIWVEGPSDILYYRKWFELYQNQEKIDRRYIEGVHFSFQVLATALWKYAGFWKEDIKSDYEEEDIRGIIDLLAVNKNNLIIIDRDTDYDISLKPSQYNEFQNNRIHKQGKNKAKLIHELIKNSEENSLSNDFGFNGLTKDQKLLFWINSGTVESYLEKFKENSTDDELKLLLKKKNGYLQCVNSRKKFELADKISNNPDLKIKEFALEEEELYKMLEGLYNTIKGWNEFKF